MTLDVDALAARAIAPLMGRRVKRREVHETMAAALIVAVNQAIAEAETVITSRRILGLVDADGRPIPRWLQLMLERETVAVTHQLRNLRRKACPDTGAGAPAGATLRLPRPSTLPPATSSPAAA